MALGIKLLADKFEDLSPEFGPQNSDNGKRKPVPWSSSYRPLPTPPLAQHGHVCAHEHTHINR